MEQIPIDQIMQKPELQFRVSVSQEAVEEYKELYSLKGVDALPPIHVFREGDDDYKIYYVADGFHRLEAAIGAGLKSINCDIIEGCYDDAVEYAARANRSHGVRFTNADKRNLVKRLVSMPKYKDMSSRQLADIAGVTHPFISKIKKVSQETTIPEKVYQNMEDEKDTDIENIIAHSGKFDILSDKLKDLMSEIKKVSSHPSGSKLNYEQIANPMRIIYSEIQKAKPCKVCHDCQGKGCKACEGTGFIGS